jgi:ABC-type lipoprotein release transport system permease subunit
VICKKAIYDYMYKNVIESYSGYIQVQQKDWWDEKTINNSLYYGEDLKQSLLDDPNVEEIIPRLESYALASSGPNTKGVIVMGIDPMKESLLSNIMDKVVKYQLSPEVIRQIQESDLFSEETKELATLFENSCYYDETRLLLDLKLDPENEAYLPFLKKISAFKHENIRIGEPGVWLGEKLANYLELAPGDTIVLMGQGYHGSTAAGKFEIKGLVKLPVPDAISQIRYFPLLYQFLPSVSAR